MDNLANEIKTAVLEEGFGAVGITDTGFLEEESLYFSSWLGNGYAAGMDYLNRNVEKRSNPSLLVPGAKSVVVALFPYNTGASQKSKYKISKYAFVPDYHFIVKDRLRKVLRKFPDLRIDGQQVFCDSAPVLERSLAYKAGLGLYGKNSMLVHKRLGSMFFIGEIFLPVVLDYDSPLQGSPCIGCEKCINACPTGALSKRHEGVDARKCLSYLTIECHDDIKSHPSVKRTSTLFGCDICQNVCPWNASLPVNTGLTVLDFVSWTDEEWEAMDENKCRLALKNSSLSRAGYSKLKDCVDFIREKAC